MIFDRNIGEWVGEYDQIYILNTLKYMDLLRE